MKKYLLNFALVVLAAGGLRANLGETDAQILSRYGKTIGPSTSLSNRDFTKYFAYKDHVVTVTLIDGQSQREAVSRKDTHPMTDAELAALLDANALGGKWSVISENKTNKTWILDSKAAIATYDKGENILIMETHMMVEFVNALKALSQKQGQ